MLNLHLTAYTAWSDYCSINRLLTSLILNPYRIRALSEKFIVAYYLAADNDQHNKENKYPGYL